jgi:hypothetical protein
MPVTVTLSAMAMPPVMPPRAVRNVPASNELSPEIGISIRIKPIAVPSRASRSTASDRNRLSFSRARSRSASARQQDHLVEVAAPLQGGLRPQAVDVAAQLAGIHRAVVEHLSDAAFRSGMNLDP